MPLGGKKRIKQKVGELFAHRYLFVQRRLSPSERATLQRICRGWPQLRQPARADGGGLPVVRSAVPDGHSVGQAGEAAGAVAAVRPAAEGAQKLLAPGLEKALVFLDERLLGATSNVVERGNRRYRKMQKTVYRVRTQRAIEGRLALDLLREQHAQGRAQTTKILHKARAA